MARRPSPMVCATCAHHRDSHSYAAELGFACLVESCSCVGFVKNEKPKPLTAPAGVRTIRPVRVTPHALARARRRHHYADDELDGRELEHAIAADVRAAFDAGRVSTSAPRWARLWRGRLLKAKARQQYVWNADESLLWVVSREEAEDVVITAMHRTVTVPS